METNLRPEQKAISLKAPPYQFTLIAAQSVVDDAEAEDKEMYHYIIEALNPNIITMVELDKKLVPLIEATDNDIFYRPLFLDNLFINTDFHFEKYIIKGIFLYELKPLSYTPKIQHAAESLGFAHTYSKKNVTFLSFVVDTVAKETVVITGTLMRDPMDEMINPPYVKLKKAIRQYICNILDFVSNAAENEIRIVKIIPSKERNEKRKMRKKIPLSTVIHIKPREKFLKYIDDFNKDSKKKANHKFQVRGHIRHYRNEKYSEDRRNKPQWIKPYYKGEGILIKKSYQLDGERL